MKTIHIISHTHWDREWYKPFQEFRLKLVRLVDELLKILESDVNYKYFMLDGQTIVLEDYLEIRPENTAKLRDYIAEGRILIGPWYILPDEFLVSPESHIRNLLKGKRLCESFGNRMMIGYIPDPFGHIGQMPQILNGFGIHKACFRRGLADEPVELIWKSKDGSEVLTSYLRDGYDNAAWLPLGDPVLFSSKSESLIESLNKCSVSSHLLFMQGTDHMFPNSNLVSCIEEFNHINRSNIQMKHSTLQDYFHFMEEEIHRSKIEIPVIEGELRECKRHELLPAVLSSRIWIKQRNHLCENLLERWVEPSSAWRWILENSHKGAKENQKEIIDFCWKMLMNNHPHDSICGCSIDQVHDEMAVRFDQVEQIGNDLVAENLKDIAAKINHSSFIVENESAIVIFNNSPFIQTNSVEFDFPMPAGWKCLDILDSGKNSQKSLISYSEPEIIFEFNFDRATLQSSLSSLQEGSISGFAIIDAAFSVFDDSAEIDLVLSKTAAPDHQKLRLMQTQVFDLLANPKIETFHIRASNPKLARIQFIPKNVPQFGYKTFYLKPCDESVDEKIDSTGDQIENEYYAVKIEKDKNSLSIYDKYSKQTFHGIHRIIDGGDVGDEYNYNPPENDGLIQARIDNSKVIKTNIEERLLLSYGLNIPLHATNDRKNRAAELINCSIQTSITLTRGIKRIDFHSKIENNAKDHRLRVSFLTGLDVDSYFTENHFEINERSMKQPVGGPNWIEQPRPEVPQRLFTMVKHNIAGIMLVNKGLPEVQVSNENHNSEITLTLLRCIGWLSRDDLSLRPRGAGPLYETPGAQMLGTHRFDYSLIINNGEWESAIAEANNFDIGLKFYLDNFHDGVLPPENSLVSINNKRVIISALKLSEDKEGIILRGYNPFGREESITITPNFSFLKVMTVNLDESYISFLPTRGNTIDLLIRPYQIFTIKFILNQNEQN